MNAFKAVFWSFFGVRKRDEYEADTQRLKPQHVIAAGIVSAGRHDELVHHRRMPDREL